MTRYRIFDAHELRAWLADHPTLASRLGGTLDAWDIREVSDGNLNTVFLVHGPQGSLCCKQALPHVRVAPDWPMPLERALYESRYMQATADAVRGLAPELYHYDEAQFLLVMECLTPHRVLRSALIAGDAEPGFSRVIGAYVARTAAATGWTTQPFERGATLLKAFSGNTALTRITVDLILTDPYHDCPRNPHAETQLRPTITALRADKALLDAVSHFQQRFLGEKQALLHGDLHTGSIMLHGTDVRVIDGEFALMGPLGFDCGLYLANLGLHLCAAPEKYDDILPEIAGFWQAFTTTYRERTISGGGDVGALLDETAREALIDAQLAKILHDTAGFAGLEMIRRTIGFAQVADYDLCATSEKRTNARRSALERGRTLLLQARQIKSAAELAALLSGGKHSVIRPSRRRSA